MKDTLPTSLIFSLHYNNGHHLSSSATYWHFLQSNMSDCHPIWQPYSLITSRQWSLLWLRGENQMCSNWKLLPFIVDCGWRWWEARAGAAMVIPPKTECDNSKSLPFVTRNILLSFLIDFVVLDSVDFFLISWIKCGRMILLQKISILTYKGRDFDSLDVWW